MNLSALAGHVLPLGLLLTACTDAGPTLSAPAPADPTARSVALACTVVTRQPALSCAPAAASARANLVLGGQGIYLRLASSGTAYDSATRIFSSNVTVQNLLPGPMGTPDGTTVYGMNVFFHSGPIATAGNGTVGVANPDGVGAFTAAAQPYFHYGAILASGAVSQPREWRFLVDPGVERFAFTLLVETRLPIETGVLRWTARTLCDACVLGRILHVGGDTLMIAGSRGGAGLLLRSFDAGATWDSVRVEVPGHTPLSIILVAGNGPHLYALVRTGSWTREILRSDDGGSTWELVPNLPSGDEQVTPMDLWAAGEEVFVAGVGCGDPYEGICWQYAPALLRSSDGLRTIARQLHPFGFGTDISEEMFIWGSGPDDLYFGTNATLDYRDGFGYVVRSTDGGRTWAGVYSTPSSWELPDDVSCFVVQVTGADAGHLWLLVSEPGKAIGSSTDSGRSWSWLDISPWKHRYRRLWAASSGEAYVLTDGPVLRVQGNRWSYQPIGLAGPYLDVSGTSERNVFITTGTGRVLHGTR